MDSEITKMVSEILRPIIKECITEAIAERDEAKKKVERYLTTQDVCKSLGVDRSTLWRWNKENYLKPIKLGAKVRYLQSQINLIMEGGAQ